MKKVWIILILAALVAVVSVCSVLTFGARQAKDFAFEQQPTAKSWGDLIGKQYSQLRILVSEIDKTVCNLEQNKQFQADLDERFGPDERTWPENAQDEATVLRQEQRTLNQVRNNLVAQYNPLRSDVRTFADNLGLEVDFIPEAQEFGTAAFPCGSNIPSASDNPG